MLAGFIILLITQLSAAQAVANLQTGNPTVSSLTSLDFGLWLVRKPHSLFSEAALLEKDLAAGQ